MVIQYVHMTESRSRKNIHMPSVKRVHLLPKGLYSGNNVNMDNCMAFQ